MPAVRSITENDIKAVAMIEAEVFSDAWTSKSILETMQQKQAFILVAEKENQIWGYCIVYYVLDEGEIARIAVNPVCRRQGVGRNILEAVREACLEKGVTRLLLDVRESNQTAREFYTDFGFQEDGIRKNFYEMPKEHAVLMSKCLE